MAAEDRQIKDRLLAELQERRQKIEQMGGGEAVEKQKKRAAQNCPQFETNNPLFYLSVSVHRP